MEDRGCRMADRGTHPPSSILNPLFSILDAQASLPSPWTDPNLHNGVIETTMPTTTNKQRVWTHVFGHLPKAARGGSAGQVRPPEGLGLLEHFLYPPCRERTSLE